MNLSPHAYENENHVFTVTLHSRAVEIYSLTHFMTHATTMTPFRHVKTVTALHAMKFQILKTTIWHYAQTVIEYKTALTQSVYLPHLVTLRIALIA